MAFQFRISLILAVSLLVFVGAVVIFSTTVPTGYVPATPTTTFKINSAFPFLDSVQLNWTIHTGSTLDIYEIQYKERTALTWKTAAVVGKNVVRVLSVDETTCTDSVCTIVMNQYDSANNKKGATRAYVISGIPDLTHKNYNYRVVAKDSKGKILASTGAQQAGGVTLGLPYCNDECLKLPF